MTARQRSVGLALLLLSGVATAALYCEQRLQGAFPVPFRITQGAAPSSPEPPLVLPPPPPSGLVIGSGPALGTPCPVDPPAPVVAIRVRVPACAPACQELCYKICVENCSRMPAHHVMVRNPIPCNARFVKADPEPNVREPELVWTLGTLEPRECREICLVLCPTGPGEIKNIARVRFEHGQCVCTKVEDCAPAEVVPPPGPTPGPGPQLPTGKAELVLRKSGPAQAVLFEAFNYQLSLANTGSEPATNVVVTDLLPPALEPVGKTSPLTWNVGTLEPGKEWKVEYQVIAKQSGKWCNQASVTATGAARQEASACVTVGKPRLEMHLNAPAERTVNSPIRYQITVINPTPVAATNVIVSDMLPPNTTVVSASDAGMTVDRQVTWALGTVPANGKKTVTLILRGSMIGEVVNKATAQADRHEPAEAEARTKLDEGAAGLTFDIDEKDDPVEVGGITTYLITVSNQGNAAAKNVTVKATVPRQMEITAVNSMAKETRDGQVITFAPVDIDAKKTATYEIMVKVLQPGIVTFAVDVNSDVFTSGKPVHKEEPTTLVKP